MEWCVQFPNVLVKHAPRIISDHCPIVVDTEGRKEKILQRTKRRFRFEAMWAKEKECSDLIKGVWEDSGEESFDVKLKRTGQQLVKWHDVKFNSMRKEINGLTKELQSTHRRDVSDDELLEEQRKRECLNALLEKEEIFWHQRSRINWLREGDKNTRFFHDKASQRRQRNWITGLFDENGIWKEDLTAITDIATNFFKNLFESQ